MVIIHHIVGHIGIIRTELVILRLLHDGIHKETAGISLFLGVGQLRVTDADDAVTQLLRRGILNSFLAQLLTDIPVVEVRCERFLQTVSHMGDQETVFPVVLKPALSIMVVAFLIRKPMDESGLDLHGLYLIYYILNLRAIGTNVLHSRGTHLSGYQTEVLSPIPLVFHAQGNDIIPRLSRSAAQQDTAIHEMTLYTLDGHMQHSTLKILRQQEVTATAQQQQRTVFLRQGGYHALDLLHRIEVDKTATLHIDAEGIPAEQTIVTDISHRLFHQFKQFPMVPHTFESHLHLLSVGDTT